MANKPAGPKRTKKHLAVAKARRMKMTPQQAAQRYPGGYDDWPGSPQHLMTERLESLLRRLRNVLPFPVPIEAFLHTVYPKEVFTPTSSLAWTNLAACIYSCEIAHFGVVGRGENETFWVRHPNGEPLPVPTDASVMLRLGKDNLYFKEVTTWLGEALVVHEGLVGVYESVEKFLRTTKHPRHVEKYWPEVYAFVGAAIEGKSLRDPLNIINPRAIELPPKSTREIITTTLAKCSLLPDSTCQAWVQYPREE